MLPRVVTDNRSRIDSAISLMESSLPAVDIGVQGFFASHLVILASGHIEISVREIVCQYVTHRSNQKISRFSIKTLEYENSLNCEKISKILDKFDTDWKSELATKILASEKEAVDSLKTLRDQIAHGKPNGTGYITVKRYYEDSCKYIFKLAEVLHT